MNPELGYQSQVRGKFMDILVADDDQSMRELLKMALEVDGYDVETAADGQEALDKIRDTESLPRLILLDQMMPVMDGQQFLDALQKEEKYSEIPVVLLSGLDSLPPALSDLATLRKPFELEDLTEVVSNTVG